MHIVTADEGSEMKDQLGGGKPLTGLSSNHAYGDPSVVEITMSVPEGLFAAFNDSDVTIDMDYDPTSGEPFTSAAITLDESVADTSFTGQGMQPLLKITIV